MDDDSVSMSPGTSVTMRITAVTCVKNEAAFLLEWLAHHKGIGFTDFLVLSNDCDDGTDAMLDRLQAMGELTHLRNDGPYGQGGIQWTGFKQADQHPLVRDADWLMTLDVDEFVNVHAGDHTLAALMAALPDADAITLTWRLFGNAGCVSYQDKPVTEQFTRAAPEVMAWPWRAFMFKTLFRNTGAYRKLGVHRPRAPVEGRVERVNWFDGEGRALPDSFRTKQLFSPFARPNYGLVQLNHYPLGAMESYVVKCDRGRVNRADGPMGMDYWVERNWNEVEDLSIRASVPLRDPHLERFHADAELRALHDSAVVWRRKRYETLMREEANRSLMGRLIMTPPARPVPPALAQNIYEFAQIAAAKKD